MLHTGAETARRVQGKFSTKDSSRVFQQFLEVSTAGGFFLKAEQWIQPLSFPRSKFCLFAHKGDTALKRRAAIGENL